MMVEPLGMLKVKVVKGKNLVVRDFFSSDPYVKLSIGDQDVKTRVIKHSLNPQWNEELTLLVPNPLQPLKLQVFDKDLFSQDDKMGDAIIDLQPLVMISNLQKGLMSFEGNMNLRKIIATSENGFAEDSTISLEGGEIVQRVCVKLQNVEKGQVELHLKLHNLPTNKPQQYTKFDPNISANSC